MAHGAVLFGPQGEFSAKVAAGTGLSIATVLAWVRAENGAHNNYLGLENTAGQLETFSNWNDAANATIQRLHQAQYAPILATAQQTSDPKTQLAAIAESPWNTGKTGPHPAYLKLLLGSLAANQAQGLTGADPGTSPKKQVTDAANGAVSTLTNGWLSPFESWIQQGAATALAYVVLTGLGLALIVFGALDFLGYSPKRVAAGATAPLRPSNLFAEA